ncbi:MAG: hypothetical protein K2K22_10115 [Muribaculaceae bacterium]|nr:hypothetical protein [Muribaculaceae bacterium]
MDTDFISAIVAVVIAVILGWAERAGKKAKLAKARQAASVQAEKKRAPRSMPKPARRKEMPEAAPAAPAASIVIGSEEGGRVTADVPAVHVDAPAKSATLKPLDADGLRNAVIWGEILQRKF